MSTCNSDAVWSLLKVDCAGLWSLRRRFYNVILHGNIGRVIVYIQC